jgi:D-beta-D-heptose 7-phosphate kinase/D-beta-D-heptose 1-phosphate adenosyltransferase
MKKIFVNGTFDILHSGHLALFNFAKSLGGHLHVGIDSDSRVKLLKGEGRPINNQSERREMLENLKPIDQVSIFSSNEELTRMIQEYGPDIMVVGSDYENKLVIGSEHAKELVFFPRIMEFSTTLKINKTKGEPRR